MVNLLTHVVNGTLSGLLYSLVAMGFVIIYRSGKVFNFAQGEVFVIGAFFVWTFAVLFNLPLWLSMILSFVCSMIFGILIEKVVLRPLIGEELFALVMITIGLLIFLRGLILVVWGAEFRAFPEIFQMKGMIIGPFVLDRALLFGGIITIAVGVLFSWLFGHTRTGLEMTAVAEDHQIALSLGLTIKRSMAISWSLSGLLSTLAAIFFLNGKVMSFEISDVGFAALPVALFAGLESIGGLVIAGLIVGVSMGLASYFLDPILQGGTEDIFPFVIMIIVLFVRPSGLFGWKSIERI
jgi:branched-chain amino acid transport system permease protein